MDTTHRQPPDQGQIPESAHYIDESTLIPESVAAHMPESALRFDHDDTHDDGLPGGRAEGLKKPGVKRAGFVSRNLPLVVIATLSAALGGAFLAKRISRPPSPVAVAQEVPAAPIPADPADPRQAAARIPQVAPAVAAPAAPAPAPALSTAPSTASAPVVPAAPAPTPRSPDRAATLAPEGPVPATASAGSAAVAAGMPTPADGAPRTPVAPAPVDTPSRQLAAALASEQARNHALEQRLAALERAQETRAPDPTVPAAAPRSAAQKARVSAPPSIAPRLHAGPQGAVAQHKAHRARHTRTAPLHASHPRAAAKPAPAAPAPRHLENYQISAVRNGIAWIDTPFGPTAVRVGDTLEGVGAVTQVDEQKLRVLAGGNIIE